MCDKTNTINHVHAHLFGFGGVCRVSVYYAQCFGVVKRVDGEEQGEGQE